MHRQLEMFNGNIDLRIENTEQKKAIGNSVTLYNNYTLIIIS